MAAKIVRTTLTGLMVVILIVAAVVSAVLGDCKDAIAILVIVVLNATRFLSDLERRGVLLG